MRRPAADRVVEAVVAVAALAVVARLVALGGRPFHWDEGRVGYWTLRFAATGVFEYRPVAGGPFVYLAARPVVELLGASDATARLPVALVGGLAPLAALLFRGRLRDDETLALAVVLAASPLLLYYGRFLRGDVPLAVFALVALGCLIRAVDDREPLYLSAGAVATALAFSASGFAVAHLLAWLVAGAVALDHRRVLGGGGTVPDRLREVAESAVDRGPAIARAVLAFLGAWIVLFAPRGRGLATDPIGLLRSSFVFPAEAFVGLWILNREGHSFLSFQADAIGTLVGGSAAVVVLAAFGVAVDRYGVLADTSRPVVTFAAAWGLVGIYLFPVVAEVAAPWVMVHVVAPLAIPAAVGVATLFRYGRRAARREDAARVAATLLLVLALGAHAGSVAVAGAYGAPDPTGPFAHHGQPADDLEPLVAEIAVATAGDDGIDVVYVGSRFHMSEEPSVPPIVSADDRAAFGERLPLPWYLERAGAETASAPGPDRLESAPPVVVADPGHRGALERRLDGYEAREYRLGLWDREVVVFVEN